MLNLPSPAPTNLPAPSPMAPPSSLSILPELALAAVPETSLPPLPDRRHDFGDLLAATAALPALPGAAPAEAAQTAPGEAELPAAVEAPAPSPALPEALSQPWALVLVPELAALPAPAPGAVEGMAVEEMALENGGDALGRAIANQASSGLWPPRLGGRVLLAATLPSDDASRPRGWQSSLPAAQAPRATATPPEAPLPAAGPAAAPVAATAAVASPAPAVVLRTITGQPIPFPTADLPPWYDPAQAPPWFDRANPPPPWSDPTRPAPLWYDPTQLPPAWLDPARIPAAWFDAPRVVDPVTPVPAAPAAPAAPVPAAAPVAATAVMATAIDQPPSPVAPMARPPAASLREAGPSPRPERPRRAPASDVAAAAERPVAPAGLAFTLPSPALPATASSAAPAPATPSGAPLPASEPALAIASERLGEVAVRLSGGPEQLQVAMQAQPAAAALIGADAPRLNQDLAAAGVALASLSVNGQRADLTGGQRERQRQPARRADDAPLSGVRRLAARQPMTRTTSVDRFA